MKLHRYIRHIFCICYWIVWGLFFQFFNSLKLEYCYCSVNFSKDGTTFESDLFFHVWFYVSVFDFILMGTCNLKYVFFLLFQVSEGYRIALKSVRFLNLRAKKYPYDIWSKLWYIFQHYVLTLLYLTVRCIMCWLILDNLIFRYLYVI